MLALFDLDGFKQYNDTFGHPAGDTLLIRLGANLAAFLHGRGRAFRMGGDEFCALFPPSGESYEPMVLGAAAALSEHGDGFSITCSHGAITLPVEAAEPVEALRVADQRMYANKHARRTSAGRQSKDVLLRALAERDPTLGTHADTVAGGRGDRGGAWAGRPRRSSACATRASCTTSARSRSRTPSSASPARSTEEEWAFVRRHPVIGERIIFAAPALAPVASLVRSSHERWDGAGYPDDLQGDAIPVGARIVAVADAFAAMTAGRPYRAARTVEEALEELRREAGTQFDPAVVDAWCTAVAAHTVSATA